MITFNSIRDLPPPPPAPPKPPPVEAFNSIRDLHDYIEIRVQKRPLKLSIL